MCIDGVCLGKDGDACTLNHHCIHGHCVHGLCVGSSRKH
jgi:hypothetical protein